ncbi:MAG: methylenetetrahydrofolate--tRNA-(uracil(54)-C(5))-methyltransferase (FADH(2)-oxidizing) TrmFO [Candidatus Fermentibacteria bacterium]|nr:methylenetetrahydrofolate--tRNA-(uracil(54)-C(5))-methyltransferase (FADH(2)-oxidizing) TrmFO [Candidatus Fermentibacteria bacterium]
MEVFVKVSIVGAGLAGSEAALQLAGSGVEVDLYEMRPGTMTPAHTTGLPAELVCSNSLRSDLVHNAPGLLKEELRRCGSFLMKAADSCRVPAGGALAVDREEFSNTVQEMLSSEKLITLIEKEVTEIPPGRVIIAAGPLASTSLTDALAKLTGSGALYFYDAIAPVVDFESVNMDRAYFQNRYETDTDTDSQADYLNCPFTEEEYFNFVYELKEGERVSTRDFEKEIHFQGCMPVEAIADSGDMSLAFGPMKPVGLVDPGTGARSFAVVQLRMENRAGTAWNLVGFQTKLTYPEQKRVFRMIPGLEKAEFIRLGSMHRNTFINGPLLLDERMQLKTDNRIVFAGQITGIEGYIESIASGYLAGVLMAGIDALPPSDTALGAVLRYPTETVTDNYQPSNINYGLFPPMKKKPRGGRLARREAQAERALKSLSEWLSAFSAEK